MKSLICLAAFGLAGCVSMGTNYDPAVAESIAIGTPRADVIAKLGPPNSRTVGADGTEYLMWLHSTGTALGTARARSVMLHFDRDGRYMGLVASNQTRIN